VARFAQLHEGRAWVEDRAGGGASFRVYLPNGAPVEDRMSVAPAVAAAENGVTAAIAAFRARR
jgi:hypothetical protein